MIKNTQIKSNWETPTLQSLDTKMHTNSGIVILPIEILGVQGPS